MYKQFIKKPYRKAPGRRILLVRSATKKEALLALRLMMEQLERIDEEENIIQSLYIDDGENGCGSAWFG